MSSGPRVKSLLTAQCLLVLLTISALTGDLATRTIQLKLSRGTSLSSNTESVARPRLDSDALEWAAPPLLHFALDEPCTVRQGPATSYLPVVSLFLDADSYNRPPPSYFV